MIMSGFTTNCKFTWNRAIVRYFACQNFIDTFVPVFNFTGFLLTLVFNVYGLDATIVVLVIS